MALAPGGVELPDSGGFRSQGRPRSPAGRPLTLEPLNGAQPVGPIVELGAVQTSKQLWGGRWGFCLTPCASAAGACGAAARPTAESTRAAAPRQRPGQQQARVRQRLAVRDRHSGVPRLRPPIGNGQRLKLGRPIVKVIGNPLDPREFAGSDCATQLRSSGGRSSNTYRDPSALPKVHEKLGAVRG